MYAARVAMDDSGWAYGLQFSPGTSRYAGVPPMALVVVELSISQERAVSRLRSRMASCSVSNVVRTG